MAREAVKAFGIRRDPKFTTEEWVRKVEELINLGLTEMARKYGTFKPANDVFRYLGLSLV